MPSRSAALARHQVRYLTSTAWLTTGYVVVPFVLIAYFQNAYRIYLHGLGYVGVSGSEIVVPGIATLYGLLVLAHDGVFTFSEHLWHSWDRVRTVATSREVVMAKLGTAWLHLILQATAIFAGSALLFSFPLGWSSVILAPVMLMTITATVAWGCLGYVLSGTNSAFDAWSYGGGMVWAAVGGAISPLGLLPSAVRRIAPLSPVYWTIKAFRAVLLDHDGLGGVLKPTGALCAFAVTFFVLAALFYDPTRAKARRVR